jgi:hypothetical protein
MPAAPKTKGKKVTCDICHKPFVVGYISTHKRRQHDVYTGRGRRSSNGNKPTFTGFKTVEDMVLLQDNQGHMWVAERIK